MGANTFLLKRYLFPEKGNLLTLALWISMAGVALGIVLLMVVLAVMSGFLGLFQENYTRITSEIVVIPKGQKIPNDELRLKISETDGVAGATPFQLGQGMVLKGGVGGVVLEGIDLETTYAVTPWERVFTEKPLHDKQQSTQYWIWLGKQLADKLSIKSGEVIDVLIAEGDARRVIPFTVTAITKFGIYDHDLHYARIDLRILNELFRRNQEPMYKVKVGHGYGIDEAAQKLKSHVGNLANVKQWSEINQNVFLAVEHQKRMLFLVLEIVIALAAMNVVNLLMMSTHHRRRDMAILRAMGMKVRGVFLFFLGQGAAVGALGIGSGIVLGYAACWAAERFQPELLSESVYNVTKLPFRIDLVDVLLVSGVAFVLCVLFSALPAWRAAVAKPVQALRYE